MEKIVTTTECLERITVDQERIAKLETKVEAIQEDVKEVRDDIKELHSRITTQTREIVEKIDDFQTRIEHRMQASAVTSKDQHDAIRKAVQEDIEKVAKQLDSDIKEVSTRVGILERWRWMILGAAGVIGFVIGNSDFVIKFFK